MRPFPEWLAAKTTWALTVVLLSTAKAGAAPRKIGGGAHDLSVGGAGGVCVFCHATHTMRGAVALWNREQQVRNYTIYRSSTMDAPARQPSGSSKLCLSCHDGTIALGRVLKASEGTRKRLGERLPPGHLNLGTDLSDDHPISFVYDAALATADPQLNAPAQLPPEVRLDGQSRLQCTSCHDAHDNRYGDFLVADPAGGALCIACHRMTGWTASAHRTSAASTVGAATAGWPYGTVGENACRACHVPHGAAGRERLLISEREEANCLACHDGSVAASDLRREIAKPTAHDPRRYQGVHDPVRDTRGGEPHVECVDCHNPHAVRAAVRVADGETIGPTLSAVPGVTSGGDQIQQARYEYEVCFRCHADRPAEVTGHLGRFSENRNLRQKLGVGAISRHPVTAPAARSSDVVSLDPAVSRIVQLRCTDCHNNDNGPGAGGSGPDGPHGSIYPFLLERNYSVADNTPESLQAYALCYKCHRQSSILGDESFPLHSRHVVKNRVPCAACHDPHGVSPGQDAGSDHTHLVNFATGLVFAEPTTGTIRFEDRGHFRGSCTLLCHGRSHLRQEYGR